LEVRSRRSFTGPGRVRVIARYWIGIRGERLQGSGGASRGGLLVILSEAKDLAREWFDLGGQDPSVAALSRDDKILSPHP
jgi:hypothetical protein